MGLIPGQELRFPQAANAEKEKEKKNFKTKITSNQINRTTTKKTSLNKTEDPKLAKSMN